MTDTTKGFQPAWTMMTATERFGGEALNKVDNKTPIEQECEALQQIILDQDAKIADLAHKARRAPDCNECDWDKVLKSEIETLQQEVKDKNAHIAALEREANSGLVHCARCGDEERDEYITGDLCHKCYYEESRKLIWKLAEIASDGTSLTSGYYLSKARKELGLEAADASR
jgi:hypothetical protein